MLISQENGVVFADWFKVQESKIPAPVPPVTPAPSDTNPAPKPVAPKKPEIGTVVI